MTNSNNLKKNVEMLSEAQSSLYYFTKNIFAKSFTNFVDGKYIEDNCNYLQKYDKSMRIAFRSGFKSTSFASYIMYKIMFQGLKNDLSIRYYSFNENLAGSHIQNLKALIDKNPFFSELINLKPLAENTAAYTWDKKHIIRIKPSGIISFSRGSKDDIVLVDDPYSDPSNLVHPTLILKINDIFKSVILETVKPKIGEIHVVASTLSRADLCFDPEIQKAFHVKFYPAIVKNEDGNEISAWPEFYTLEQLKEKIPVMGERAWQSEMLCTPYYSTDTFFKKEQLRKDVVNPQLKNIRLLEGFNTSDLVVAGLDIGKLKHPAEFNVFHIKNNKAIHIHRKEMIKWNYYTGKPYDPLKPSQVEYCLEAIKNFGISFIYYDDTRGEFQGARDSGLLTDHFIPIVFTPKMRIQMATEFEKAVLNKQVEIFDDEEMLNSICSVTNDLISIETAGGRKHSDCFWSIALALIGLSKFGNFDAKDRIPRVGSPSIFEGKIPKGF